MGFIRKSLKLGSLGVVKGDSKKQRNAKAQLVELRRQTAALAGVHPDPKVEARGQAALARARELQRLQRLAREQQQREDEGR